MNAFLRINDHLTIEQAMERMQMIACLLQLKKWLVIYTLPLLIHEHSAKCWKASYLYL